MKDSSLQSIKECACCERMLKNDRRYSFQSFELKGLLHVDGPQVDAVEARISAATGLPPEFAEGMHVLKYESDQKYEAHYDACVRPETAQPSEQCIGFLKRGGGPGCGEGAGEALQWRSQHARRTAAYICSKYCVPQRWGDCSPFNAVQYDIFKLSACRHA